MTYSIIIPTFNEESNIERCLQNVMLCLPNCEIIVVDGGSQDKTVDLAKALGVRVLNSIASRGTQCGVGASIAKGEVFVFLHVDSILFEGTKALLDEHFVEPKLEVATFSILFDGKQSKYRIFEWGAKFETFFTTYGDQGIIVTKDFYTQQVAMPKMKLFEDVEFFRLARKQTKITKLKIPILTSVRRFEKKGFVRMNLLNSMLLLAYGLGINVEFLHRVYYK